MQAFQAFCSIFSDNNCGLFVWPIVSVGSQWSVCLTISANSGCDPSSSAARELYASHESPIAGFE